MKNLTNRLSLIAIFSLAGIFTSCEDLIDVNLNAADPRYVIEADFHEFDPEQVVRITQTVPFDSDIASRAVEDAVVTVREGNRIYNFRNRGNGLYGALTKIPFNVGNVYTLHVKIGDEEFTSNTEMVDYVAIDSIGTLEENIFNEMFYSVQIKFQDPPSESNYYRYLISINGGKYTFAAAFNDKYNNGLIVSHQISNQDNTLEVGDVVEIIRQSVTKDVFSYWNDIQMLNPGSAAPANPTSNISNGALGYFSVSSSKRYEVMIEKPDQSN